MTGRTEAKCSQSFINNRKENQKEHLKDDKFFSLNTNDNREKNYKK